MFSNINNKNVALGFRLKTNYLSLEIISLKREFYYNLKINYSKSQLDE